MNRLRKLALAASLLSCLAFLGASPVAAYVYDTCSGTPYVWLYSEGNQNSGQSAADEIKFCYGSYPTGILNTHDVKHNSNEFCRGIFGVDWGSFKDCLSSFRASSSGWNGSITLCLYNNVAADKGGGWSYIKTSVVGNMASSMNDTISSVRWVTGGSANC